MASSWGSSWGASAGGGTVNGTAVSPINSRVRSSSVAPTVVAGPMTPAVIYAVSGKVDPTVLFGSVTVTPSSGSVVVLTQVSNAVGGVTLPPAGVKVRGFFKF